MLDKPEKTAALLATMRTALPFEVSLTPEVATHLANQEKPLAVQDAETVNEVSYAGDEGGIICHIKLADGGNMVVASLTHVRVTPKLPFAADVVAYQKHRVKKLKQLARR